MMKVCLLVCVRVSVFQTSTEYTYLLSLNVVAIKVKLPAGIES
jgi:hypothetical protein